MKIQQFNNIFISKIKNNFSTNKDSQNPINFGKRLTSDRFELRGDYSIHKPVSPALLETFERDKIRVLQDFDLKFIEIQELQAEEEEKRNQLLLAKDIAMQMVDDEEFSSGVEAAINTYSRESAKLKGFQNIEKILSSNNPNRKIKSLTTIITNNFPEYIQKATDEASDSLDFMSLAQTIKEDFREQAQSMTPEADFERNIEYSISQYSEQQSLEIDSFTQEATKKALIIPRDITYPEFKKELGLRFDKEIDKQNYFVLRAQDRYSQYMTYKDEYLEAFRKNPITSPLYDPFISSKDRVAKVTGTGYYASFSNSDFPQDLIATLEKNGYLTKKVLKSALPIEPDKLYDLKLRNNIRTFNLIGGKENKLIYIKNAARKYNIPMDVMKEMPIGVISITVRGDRGKKKELLLVNVKDNADFLEQESVKWERTRSKRSRYIDSQSDYKFNTREIPASYFARLGFGNLPTLRQLVQQGELMGRVDIVQTESGKKFKTTLDTSDPRLPQVLHSLRERNKGIIKANELAAKLGVSQKQLYKDIADGMLDIIPEYIFCGDGKHRFIDRRTEKNKAYVETKLFEKEVARQLKQAESERLEELRENRNIFSDFDSLRMSLVWQFCPNTRAVASNLAKQDGHLVKLLIINSDGANLLTDEEEAKVRAYRKNVWEIAGTEEYKAGFKKADAAIKQLKEGGLAAVEDEGARKVFEEYGIAS